MSIVVGACNRILTCLQIIDQGSAQGLQAGLSRNAIEEKAKELMFPLPEEVYQFYQWRNGNPWSNQFINANYWMLSLENALDVYRLRGSFADIRDLYYDCNDRENKEDNYFWNRHWFPVFCGRDEYRFWIVVIGQESSPVLDIIPGEQCVELYPSLSQMLTAEAECFEKVIELLNGRNCYPDDIELYPDDERLMNIRHRHGYQCSYF
jgi:SMI1 / KNR4 family (SUKH-1)